MHGEDGLSIAGPFGIHLDMDALPDGFVYVDEAGVVRAFNRQAELLFGYATSEVVGLPLSTLIPEVRDYFTRRLARVTGAEGMRGLPARRKDGSRLYVDLSLRPVPADGGNHAVVLIRAAPDTEDRYLASVLTAVADGVYAVDAQGYCTFINGAAERLLGYEAGELNGREMWSFLRGPQPNPMSYLLVNCPEDIVCAEGKPCRLGEVKIQRKDGSIFTAEYSMSPLCETGRIVGAVAVFRDITKMRALVRELNMLANQDVDLALNGDRDFKLSTFAHPGASAGGPGGRPWDKDGIASAGGELYRVRPLSAEDPGAKVRQAAPAAPGREADAWSLDLTSGRLDSPDGKGVSLTSRELELLQHLMGEPYTMITKHDLFYKLYPRHKGGDDYQRVTTLLSRLRSKVGDELGIPLPVRTVFGRGFVFAGPARISPPPPM
ncbi:MAG: PAS domain S-box protein [Gammaproteobacteria bacterium]|nr:PAS domain S-box protein [Gammaproteobacteria bacterium]